MGRVNEVGQNILVTLNKFPKFPSYSFLTYKMKNNGTYLIGLIWRINESVFLA